jgi:integrase
MGRPPLDIGTFGRIRVYPLPDGRSRAETLYRDADGVTRLVKRVGKSAAAAERNLKKALADRQRPGAGQITGDSKFADVGELWLAEIHRNNPGSTYDRYRGRLRNGINPAFGQLRLREITTGMVDSYLRELEKRWAPNTVRSYRTVLADVLGYAVRFDAIPRNPVEGAGRIHGGNSRATKRALTAEERTDLLLKLDLDERACSHDLPDILRYMMGTGVRLGECLGLRWLRVDLEEGVSVHGDSLHRVTGKGLLLKEPKTLAGFRVLPLPDFVVMMLRARYPGPGYELGPVFGMANGNWRSPENFVRYIRDARELAGYPWFTTHVCRRTAATILDEQGLTARETSGYIGHANPSFTQNFYMDQTHQSGAAPKAIDAAYRSGQNGSRT